MGEDKKFHYVEEIQFSGPVMRLRCDGTESTVELSQVSKRLAQAGNAEREAYRISPSGYGVHWAAIDEDLSIDGLIQASRDSMPVASDTAFILKDSPRKKR